MLAGVSAGEKGTIGGSIALDFCYGSGAEFLILPPHSGQRDLARPILCRRRDSSKSRGC
jgi:hypothetical protein